MPQSLEALCEELSRPNTIPQECSPLRVLRWFPSTLKASILPPPSFIPLLVWRGSLLRITSPRRSFQAGLANFISSVLVICLPSRRTFRRHLTLPLSDIVTPEVWETKRSARRITHLRDYRIQIGWSRWAIRHPVPPKGKIILLCHPFSPCCTWCGKVWRLYDNGHPGAKSPVHMVVTPFTQLSHRELKFHTRRDGLS